MTIFALLPLTFPSTHTILKIREAPTLPIKTVVATLFQMKQLPSFMTAPIQLCRVGWAFFWG